MAVVTQQAHRRPAERLVTSDDQQLDERARSVLLTDLLRVVSPATLETIIHRAERSYPAWRLPGTGSVHERLGRYLGDRS